MQENPLEISSGQVDLEKLKFGYLDNIQTYKLRLGISFL